MLKRFYFEPLRQDIDYNINRNDFTINEDWMIKTMCLAPTLELRRKRYVLKKELRKPYMPYLVQSFPSFRNFAL
jgi:hypothetical protein